MKLIFYFIKEYGRILFKNGHREHSDLLRGIRLYKATPSDQKKSVIQVTKDVISLFRYWNAFPDTYFRFGMFLKDYQIKMICDSGGLVGLCLVSDFLSKLGLSDKIFFEYGDSTALSLPSDSFDAVTVAFGVRNFSSLSDGLKQMAGVLKKGGVAAILEMTEPENVLFKLGYKIYTKIGIPVLAKLMSGEINAYNYLPASIEAFPQGEEMKKLLIESGFSKVEIKKFTLQTCTFYLAIK